MKPGWLSRGIYHVVPTVCRYLFGPAMTCLTGVRHFNVPAASRLSGVLIASNHQSFLDPVLIGIALERPIHYLARRSLFHVPGLNVAIRMLGAHPVSRDTKDGTAVRTILRILRSGEAMLLFPEGTRSWDGSVGAFQAGVGSIAARFGVPVLPVCIEGAVRCWPRTRSLPAPARVAVAYGELVSPAEGDAAAITNAVIRQIVRMQDFLRQHLAYGAPGR